MEVDTEANVYEPFEEYVKQVEVKPLKLTRRCCCNRLIVVKKLCVMV